MNKTKKWCHFLILFCFNYYYYYCYSYSSSYYYYASFTLMNCKTENEMYHFINQGKNV